MADIKLKGNPIHTSGELPAKGGKAPGFKLVKTDLSEVDLSAYAGKKKVVNIFPSIDTGVCAASVRKFNEKAGAMTGVVVLNISKDLPFAQKRWCGAEGLENVEALSTFRSNFAREWNVEIIDGPMKGLCSRAVVVLDQNDQVLYTEQVPEITQEPNYDAALAALK